MSGSWTASVEIPTRAWTRLSDDLDPQDQGAWVADQVEGLRELWSRSWQDEWVSDIEYILINEANSRGNERLFTVLCWPVPGPVVARVAVRVVPMVAVDELKEIGFEVDSYHGADIGPGVQCVGSSFVDVEGERVEAAVAHYLFCDGENMVQVDVGPTFAQAFRLMTPELQEFIDSLKVRRPDGRPFAAVSNPAVPFVANEEWV